MAPFAAVGTIRETTASKEVRGTRTVAILIALAACSSKSESKIGERDAAVKRPYCGSDDLRLCVERGLAHATGRGAATDAALAEQTARAHASEAARASGSAVTMRSSNYRDIYADVMMRERPLTGHAGNPDDDPELAED